jgi:hypothetical protein
MTNVCVIFPRDDHRKAALSKRQRDYEDDSLPRKPGVITIDLIIHRMLAVLTSLSSSASVLSLTMTLNSTVRNVYPLSTPDKA